MENHEIDIVIPVWNRPVETRNCLVNLLKHSPFARFILVDNGSDKETELILQEFAEHLVHRALLLRNDVNQGYVRAVNRGLARGEGAFVAVLRNTSLVSAGWLEPMVAFATARPDAGLLIPRLTADYTDGKRLERCAAAPIETDHASLSAMLVSRPLYSTIGGLDEELDGGEWCLRDYSRRALKSGFMTFCVDGGTVRYTEDAPLGSLVRRIETLERSIAKCRERWGKTGDFCILLPKEADLSLLWGFLTVLLQGARYGHRFTVLLNPGLYKGLIKMGWRPVHENITLKPLPLLFASAAARRALACCREYQPSTVAVKATDGMEWPGVDNCIPFARLEQEVADLGREKYGVPLLENGVLGSVMDMGGGVELDGK
ncbi:MAG: glycosyltransferase [Geobacteraceae bacterium]